MTLLELTVVIVVLLTFVTVLFFGTHAWKNGSDRTLCILNIQYVQKAVRSYSNLYGYSPGAAVTGLHNQIIGIGRYVENTPECPGGGSYVFGPDMIPDPGVLYMECSLSSSNRHEPVEFSEW